MQKKVMSLAIFCLISLSNGVNAQTTQTNTTPTVPTEAGTTTMPAGNYLLIDQNSGNKFSLTVTAKGTMIFGPAPAASNIATTSAATPATANPSATSKTASGVKGMAEKQVEKFIENKGMSEVQNFIK